MIENPFSVVNCLFTFLLFTQLHSYGNFPESRGICREKLRHRDLESENYVRHMERNIIGMEFHLKLRMKVSNLAR